MDSRKPLFLFAGGGSGGHLFPGLALADELRKRRPGAGVLFAVSNKAIDRRVLDGAGVESVVLPAESPSSAWRSPWAFARGLVASWAAARRLISERRPAAVVGLGGFASVAVVRCAARSGVPIVLLEQNAVPGRATRWLARSADAICLTFAESFDGIPRAARSRCHVTGNPVRDSIVALAERRRGDGPHDGPTAAATSISPPTLLVLGGSQGSGPLNDGLLAAVAKLTEPLRDWRIVHQAGANHADAVANRYAALGVRAEVAGFLDDLPTRYRTASLVVSRAGATTLSELACAGLPSVLVPYRHAADDHQTANASVFERAGAAVVVRQGNLSGETADRLAVELTNLLASNERRAAMARAARSLAKPEAAAAVADLVEQIVPDG